MKIEYFIAKRLITTKDNKSSISAPIIKIAITAIAIGILMMIVSVATGMGLQKKIRQKVAAFSGHIIISNYNNNESEVSTEPIKINQNFYPKFKDIDGIKYIQAVGSKAGMIRTEDAFEGIIFKGVGKDYHWDDIEEYLVMGKVPNLKNTLNSEIVISQYLSTRLKLKLGDSFNTFFMKEDANKIPNLRRFKIVGIYNSGFQEFDSNYIIGDIRHLQLINKWKKDEVGSFEIFLEDFSKIKEIGIKVYSQTSSTLDSKTILDKYYYIFDWLKLFDFNIIVILVVMIMVSTINMVVALLVLILERTQMIGVLKSIGANNWAIRKIFLFNALHLIFKGLFFGNLIGITLLVTQHYFGIVKLNPESYYVDIAPVDINIFNILLLNIGTVILCILILLIPSYLITRITPAKSINFN